MKLAGYLRVSTDLQAERGLGLEVQRVQIEEWCAGSGHELVLWSRELGGVSGANELTERLALPDALVAIRDGIAEGLVVYNLDRLARKLTVQEAILALVWDAGGRVFSLGDGGEVLEDDPDDPMRTAVRQMRGVFAQLERAMIAKRLRDGRARKHANGGFAYGAPPFGWRAEKGELVAVPEEQAVIDRIRDLRATVPPTTLRAIADTLNAEGHRTQRGGEWKSESVRRVVRRLGRDARCPDEGHSSPLKSSRSPAAR